MSSLALTWETVKVVSQPEALQGWLGYFETDPITFPATSWQEFSVAGFFVNAIAQLESDVSAILVAYKNAMLLDTSSGVALTDLSDSLYDNQREDPLEAQRRITLACEAGEGPHSIALGAVVIADADGNTVRNVAGLSVVYPATLPSGGTLELLFEAEVAGSQANTPDGSYTNLVTTLAGVTVSQDLHDRDGLDQEGDDRLKLRDRSKWGALAQLAPVEASITFIALNAAPSITQVGLDRTNPRGEGTFDVYLAMAGDTAGTTEVSAVQSALDQRVFGDTSGAANTRPGYARPAPVVPLDLTGTVYYSKSSLQEDVQTDVEKSLTEFLETIPLGGFKYAEGLANLVTKTDLETRIKTTTGVVHATLSTPSADVSVAAFGKVTRGTWLLTFLPGS